MDLVTRLALETFRASGEQSEDRLKSLIVHYGTAYGYSVACMRDCIGQALDEWSQGDDIVVYVWFCDAWRIVAIQTKFAGRPSRAEVEDHIQAMNKCGYVAHRGTLSIGPPEGPPSDADFKAVEQ